jgi:AP endonuclease-2
VEEWMAFVPNYSSYFSFPKHRTGYSGVVSYCEESIRPFGVEDSLIKWDEIISESDESFELSNSFSESQTKSDLKNLDSEGRVIISKHLIQMSDSLINLHIFNVYCPRADPERTDRKQFKLNFYKLLEEKAKYLIKKSKDNYVIIMGDINTSHKRIDNCDPSDDFELDASRQWLSQLLAINETEDSETPHFIDVFRYLYPNRSESYTCWNTMLGSRLTNFGTRIDYIIADSRLQNYIKDCLILSDILGSDHCPVMIEFKNIKPIASPQLSKLCTKVWPEFGNCRQSTLTDFLTKPKSKNSLIENETNNKINVKKLKISRQTVLSNFFPTTSANNSSAQSVKLDINELESKLLSKRGNELNTAISCSENSDNCKASHFNNQNSCQTESVVKQWKNVFKALPKPPNCTGHCEPCLLRKVTKVGPNLGKKFFVCNRPVGNASNRESSCNFFKWAKDVKN